MDKRIFLSMSVFIIFESLLLIVLCIKKECFNVRLKKILVSVFVSIVFFLIIIFFLNFLLCSEAPMEIKIAQNNDWIGFYGCIFGGLVGGVATLIVIYITINENSKIFDRQNFENIFYNMVSSHRDIIGDLVIYYAPTNVACIGNEYLGERLLAYEYHRIFLTIKEYSVKSEIKKKNRDQFLEFLDNNFKRCELDILYNHSFSILKFVDNYKFKDHFKEDEKKQVFIDYFKKQLSFYHLLFIALLAVKFSKRKGTNNELEIFKRYNFFELLSDEYYKDEEVFKIITLIKEDIIKL